MVPRSRQDQIGVPRSSLSTAHRLSTVSTRRWVVQCRARNGGVSPDDDGPGRGHRGRTRRPEPVGRVAADGRRQGPYVPPKRSMAPANPCWTPRRRSRPARAGRGDSPLVADRSRHLGPARARRRSRRAPPTGRGRPSPGSAGSAGSGGSRGQRSAITTGQVHHRRTPRPASTPALLPADGAGGERADHHRSGVVRLPAEQEPHRHDGGDGHARADAGGVAGRGSDAAQPQEQRRPVRRSRSARGEPGRRLVVAHLAVRPAKKSTLGQPWRACHQRLGRATTTRTRRASRGPRPRRAARPDRVATKPTANAAEQHAHRVLRVPRQAGGAAEEHAMAHGRPAAAPARRPQRPAPSRADRTTPSGTWRCCRGASGVIAMAAISWARRPPPRSRAISGGHDDHPGPGQRGDGPQPDQRVQPNSTRASAASTGVTDREVE